MNKITKTNYYNSFSLVGTPKMNDNTFKIDEISESGWQYNQLNLALDCGENMALYIQVLWADLVQLEIM